VRFADVFRMDFDCHEYLTGNFLCIFDAGRHLEAI
jgi:hypothetical protein